MLSTIQQLKHLHFNPGIIISIILLLTSYDLLELLIQLKETMKIVMECEEE